MFRTLRNHIHSFLWGIIIHPCHNFKETGLAIMGMDRNKYIPQKIHRVCVNRPWWVKPESAHLALTAEFWGVIEYFGEKWLYISTARCIGTHLYMDIRDWCHIASWCHKSPATVLFVQVNIKLGPLNIKTPAKLPITGILRGYPTQKTNNVESVSRS